MRVTLHDYSIVQKEMAMLARKDVLSLIHVSIASVVLLCPLVASGQLTIRSASEAPPVAAPSATTAPAVEPPATVTPAPSITVIHTATTAPAPTIAPALESPASTQSFVGTVTADKVYVRSGSDAKYYELGHLGKGDTVQVVGSRNGWYRILPPNGVYCMVAKEYIDLDTSGDTGTVKADYLNVRAGTALNKTRDPSAVLAVVRKGTQLTILGASDKHYEVAPPEKAYVYVSSQFITAAPADTAYVIPTLQLPAGVTGPSRATVTSIPTTLPTATAEISGEKPEATSPKPEAQGLQSRGSADTNAPPTTLPAPVPTPAFSADAYKRFDELNARYQAELRKPVGTRELDGLIADYKALLASKEPMPSSVKQGSEVRLADLEKLATIQRLQKENAASADALDAQRKALQEKAKAAEDALKAFEHTGPYLAEGTLQTSTVVPDKYALVNPATGRTVAYVDPKSAIDIGSLLGKYIGVRGVSRKAQGTDMEVIQVKTATLIEAPTLPKK
ncbi:MAG: hypothetical protein FWD61_10305 [Phycisphaerales bacterium]|nr:hypothetical protein [Phycisphaerales bacterium]